MKKLNSYLLLFYLSLFSSYSYAEAEYSENMLPGKLIKSIHKILDFGDLSRINDIGKVLGLKVIPRPEYEGKFQLASPAPWISNFILSKTQILIALNKNIICIAKKDVLSSFGDPLGQDYGISEGMSNRPISIYYKYEINNKNFNLLYSINENENCVSWFMITEKD